MVLEKRQSQVEGRLPMGILAPSLGGLLSKRIGQAHCGWRDDEHRGCQDVPDSNGADTLPKEVACPMQKGICGVVCAQDIEGLLDDGAALQDATKLLLDEDSSTKDGCCLLESLIEEHWAAVSGSSDGSRESQADVIEENHRISTGFSLGEHCWRNAQVNGQEAAEEAAPIRVVCVEVARHDVSQLAIDGDGAGETIYADLERLAGTAQANWVFPKVETLTD
jgi:hypothetical protein